MKIDCTLNTRVTPVKYNNKTQVRFVNLPAGQVGNSKLPAGFCVPVFTGNILENFDSDEIFDINDENLFNINFLKKLSNDLMQYKKESDAMEAVYLINEKASAKSSKNNVTLMQDSSVNTINAEIADLHDTSKSTEVKASKGAYLFDDAKAVKLNAPNIFLLHNSKAEDCKADILWLVNNSSCNHANVSKLYQRNYSTMDDVTADEIVIKDFAHIKNAYAKNIVLEGNSGIEEAKIDGGKIKVLGKSQVDSLLLKSSIQDSTEISKSYVVLDKNSVVKTIVSDEGCVDITGRGTIGDIYTKGSSVIIHGPVNIKGKIVFLDNPGSIVVQKAPYNIYPQITSENVENGKLQFLMQKGETLLIGNTFDSFDKSLTTIEHSKLFQPQEDFSKYTDLETLKKYYDKNNPKLAAKLDNYLSKPNGFIIKEMYEEFFNSTLQTLNLQGENKKFTLFWLNNAKIGEKNLVDFWFNVLGKNPEGINQSNKVYFINNLSDEQKAILTEKTVQYWISEVLPDLYDRANYSDLSILERNSQKISDLVGVLKTNPELLIKQLDDKNYYNSLKTYTINGKKVVDLWLESAHNPQLKSMLKVDRLTVEYLKLLILAQDSRDSIISSMENETVKQEKLIDNFRYAVQDLLQNEDSLDKSQLKILKKFQNSADLYNLVRKNIQNITDKTEIEAILINILNELSSERDELAIKARREIFANSFNMHKVVNAAFDPVMNSYMNFVAESYNKSLGKFNNNQLSDAQFQVESLRHYVVKNSLYFEPIWKDLVENSYRFFQSITLDKVTAENIRMLADIIADSAERKNPKVISDLITGNYLDTIEKKDFVNRYKGDCNFITMLKNDGINKKEILSELIIMETINENLYKQRLDSFSKNITSENVITNLDIADEYLKILDYDYPDMTIKEKQKALSSLTKEERILLNNIIFQNWHQDGLKKFMTQKFEEVQLEYNINYQGKHMKDILSRMEKSLDNIRVNVQGQTYTMREIVQNLDKIALYSEKSFKELYFISDNIEQINKNTESIKANTRAILYTAMQNSKIKDPQLSNMIKELLPEVERESLSGFLFKVDEKCKQIKEEKRKAQLQNVGRLVLTFALSSMIGAACPDCIGDIISNPEMAENVINGVKHITSAVNHVALFKAMGLGLQKS